MAKKLYDNRKKILTRLAIVAVLAMSIGYLQFSLMQVTAQVIPVSVNVGELNFGNVFPGETLDKNFTVTYSDDSGAPANYQIVQKIKPLPGAVVPAGFDGTISQYCQKNPTDIDRCYKNLCPYIIKISQNGDTEKNASVGPNNLTDTWTVHLAVPAILGNVAQDNTGGIVSAAGDYGCDIAIDVAPSADSVCGTKFFDANQDGVKGTSGEQGLSGWTINLTPITETLVEELDVPGTGGVVTTASVLTNGQEYRIEASGTYFAGGNTPTDIEADAKFSQDDYQAANNLPWTDSVHNYESYGADLLNLEINNLFVDWGNFSASHIYSYNLTGDGNQANFQIYDIYYPNNSGQLHVKIFKVTASQVETEITDTNGNYCFYDVPAGLYRLSEVLKNGWSSTVPINPAYYEFTMNITDQLTRDFGNFSPTFVDPVCGNGIKEAGEECDTSDGVTPGYYCTAQCTLAIAK